MYSGPCLCHQYSPSPCHIWANYLYFFRIIFNTTEVHVLNRTLCHSAPVFFIQVDLLSPTWAWIHSDRKRLLNYLGKKMHAVSETMRRFGENAETGPITANTTLLHLYKGFYGLLQTYWNEEGGKKDIYLFSNYKKQRKIYSNMALNMRTVLLLCMSFGNAKYCSSFYFYSTRQKTEQLFNLKLTDWSISHCFCKYFCATSRRQSLDQWIIKLSFLTM